ncbi:piwi-like protein Siwi isoform X2 [Adelges cooleyi]|nr:piwi-like protein Siwi isoform X2 [Adelges cooleyi]XP_050438180.1 piwi-like protein Siwi isoform X2 [Adelges cooleyi]XP_050438182.1 piwi-like protein Siwi isoform X2 [Adelges cooleyi]XP_050438183.1 piwi-like protein Siwi isoform X2 [Adelges cooleyi]XP_050438184.1 piwi-like protein Siwi isoform X2 [Adelges cooleyi]
MEGVRPIRGQNSRGRAHNINRKSLRQSISSRPVCPPIPRGLRPVGPRLNNSQPVMRPPGPLPRPQVQPNASTSTPPVDEVTRDLKKLVTADANVSLGPPLKSDRNKSNENYIIPRPESSLGETGKRGSMGSELKLIANYFPITSHTTWELYQYYVTFSPEEDHIGVKKNLLGQHRQRFGGGYLFDGTRIFTNVRLQPESFELTSQRRHDNKMFTLKIKFTNVLNNSDYAYIQVFSILMRKCIQYIDLKLIGKNFFDLKAKFDIPEHKLQLLPGYVTSIARYENNQILFCMDITTRVMRQETVLGIFHQYAATRNKDPEWMMAFKNNVIGTTVMTMYNNESYRIDDVDENSDPSSTFSKKDGTQISYQQYYKEQWNLDIRGGRQPMLISKYKKKSVRQFGAEDTLVYLVPEFCKVTGLTNELRNNFKVMKDVAAYTQLSPNARIKRYYSLMEQLVSNKESVDELKNWDLKFSKTLVEVPARVLKNENISSNTKSYTGGTEADWTTFVRSQPMYACALMKCWVILAPQQDIDDVKVFVSSLEKAARGMSFKLPQPVIVGVPNTRCDTVLIKLEQKINEYNPTLVLCAIPPSGQLYNVIKRKLCIDRAVPSQVVLLKNVRKNNLSVATKIAIQMNCKIGGAPWHVAIPRKGMMIVGFDVYHTLKGSRKISYGALIATLGDSHTSVFSCVEPHAVGEELSNHFATSMSKALHSYRIVNNQLPKYLIIYRDGVGEGQIPYVHKTEVSMLKAVCKKFYGENSVPMAFLIVTKRITARFFTKEGLQNPPAGTIVDSVVTVPTKYDFYLIAQQLRHSTVTPTHYRVIEDTLNLKPEYMQTLTYKLCHMYYNWSGTIRVPAPCQLAHKLAYFTGQTLAGAPNPALDRLMYFL